MYDGEAHSHAHVKAERIIRTTSGQWRVNPYKHSIRYFIPE
jgi:hypothetical protein